MRFSVDEVRVGLEGLRDETEQYEAPSAVCYAWLAAVGARSQTQYVYRTCVDERTRWVVMTVTDRELVLIEGEATSTLWDRRAEDNVDDQSVRASILRPSDVLGLEVVAAKDAASTFGGGRDYNIRSEWSLTLSGREAVRLPTTTSLNSEAWDRLDVFTQAIRDLRSGKE